MYNPLKLINSSWLRHFIQYIHGIWGRIIICQSISEVTEYVISFFMHKWVDNHELNLCSKTLRFEFLWVKEDKKRRRSTEKGIKKCQIRKRKENINYFRKRLFTGENWEELKLLKSQNTEHRFLFPHNEALRELTQLSCNNRHEKLHWKQSNYTLFFRRKTFLKLLSEMQMTLITCP